MILSKRRLFLFPLLIIALLVLGWQAYQICMGRNYFSMTRQNSVTHAKSQTVMGNDTAHENDITHLPPPYTAAQHQYLKMVEHYQMLKMQEKIAESSEKIMEARLRSAKAQAALRKYATTNQNEFKTGNHELSKDEKFKLVYTGQQAGEWGATLKNDHTLYNVSVGSRIGESEVVGINKESVTLETNKRLTVVTFNGHQVLPSAEDEAQKITRFFSAMKIHEEEKPVHIAANDEQPAQIATNVEQQPAPVATNVEQPAQIATNAGTTEQSSATNQEKSALIATNTESPAQIATNENNPIQIAANDAATALQLVTADAAAMDTLPANAVTKADVKTPQTETKTAPVETTQTEQTDAKITPTETQHADQQAAVKTPVVAHDHPSQKNQAADAKSANWANLEVPKDANAKAVVLDNGDDVMHASGEAAQIPSLMPDPNVGRLPAKENALSAGTSDKRRVPHKTSLEQMSNDDAKLIASENVILSENPASYTVQWLSDTKLQAVLDFMQAHKLSDQAHYFLTFAKGGHPRYILISGEYATIRDANSAIKSMPPSMQKAGPYVRHLSDVQAAINVSAAKAKT